MKGTFQSLSFFKESLDQFPLMIAYAVIHNCHPTSNCLIREAIVP